MTESTAILLSIAAIAALIPVFLIGRKHGKKNLAGLKLAIAESVTTLRAIELEIPDGEYSISEIERWFRNWKVMIEFGKTTIVLMKFQRNTDPEVELIQSGGLERKG